VAERRALYEAQHGKAPCERRIKDWRQKARQWWVEQPQDEAPLAVAAD
jgi:hypothetical protein